jgi:2-polyprenyl-6-hydroxyphenyl methylase/3-demethylubiquinone-9 3-methyltransferase
MLPQGTHEFSKMIQPSELAGFARRADLSVLGLQGLTYQPFTQRYALSPDTGVNYLMVCQAAA